jgi:hypothetical protein
MAQVRHALRTQRSVTKRDFAALFITQRTGIETQSGVNAAARLVSTVKKEPT